MWEIYVLKKTNSVENFTLIRKKENDKLGVIKHVPMGNYHYVHVNIKLACHKKCLIGNIKFEVRGYILANMLIGN